MPTLRILQVLPELNIGGVERTTLDMVKALRQIFPVTYVASQGGSLLPELQNLGGTHFTLPLASKNPFQMVRNAIGLVRLIRDHDIHLIHARSRAPAWSALWAARWTKIPLVTTFHGAYRTSNIFKTFYNSIMTRGTRVIAISEFVLLHIQQQYPTSLPRIRLIHEGIDVEAFDPQHVSREEIKILRKTWNIPTDAKVFLLPGRVTRLKGQIVFIEALRQLNNSNVFGIILGRSQGNSSYSQEVDRQLYGLQIQCFSHTQNLKVAYAAADLIVSPSLAPETFGRVTAEAGAMGRIIIATNHGATPELCKTGITGYLIPPGDIKALTQAMNKVLKMAPEGRKAMEKKARDYVCENFSLKRMCSETIALYKEILE
jgi:glycosyltransferase involved in cell wall biosynthesis